MSALISIDCSQLELCEQMSDVERRLMRASLLCEAADAHLSIYDGCEVDRDAMREFFEVIKATVDQGNEMLRKTHSLVSGATLQKPAG